MSESLIPLWLSGTLGVICSFSSIILSVQRLQLHREQLTDQSPLRFDDKKDPSSPDVNDKFRIGSIEFGTVLLTALSTIRLYESVDTADKHWITIASYIIQWIGWLYGSLLLILSLRYKLPNKWGWILNVHLFIFFTMTWLISLYDLYASILIFSDIHWQDSFAVVFSFLMNTYLVLVTMTAPRGPSMVDQNNRPVAGTDVASIYSFLFFTWVTPLLRVAQKNKKLTNEDLPSLAPIFRAFNLYYIFGATRGKKLVIRLYKTNRRAIIIQIVLTIITSLAFYVPAYFFNQFLILIQSMNGRKDQASVVTGVLIIAGLAVTALLNGLAIGQLWYYASSFVQVRVKAMLNLEIYRKTLLRRDLAVDPPKIDEEEKKEDTTEKKEKPEDKANSTAGNIVNLMSTDSNRISEFSTWWSTIIAAPTELAIGIYFLYHLLGFSCFLGLLVMIIVLPLSHFNAKTFINAQNNLMEARDKRISLMNEVLQGIRQIKFFGWEENWGKRIMESRDQELHQLGITYKAGVGFNLLWQGSPILVTLVSFWSFTKLEGKELTAPIAFTSITVFNELRFALNVLPELIMEGLQCMISVNRIQSYLDEGEIDPPDPVTNSFDVVDDTIHIGFKEATIGWKQESYTDEEQPEDSANSNKLQNTPSHSFILKDLNVDFPLNQLSLITGATGSGKTLMMLSLLGEVVTLKGSVYCPRQAVSDNIAEYTEVSEDIDPKDWLLPYAVAYVSQTAWLQNASIRDNILFGLPMVEERYRATLSACALDKDLDIFDDGDMTEIGEKGITLSGGQKARVSLARAVYSRAQIVLMDDVLSACLTGPLMEGRTRVLITHHVRMCIKGSAYIVSIENGRINLIGEPNQLRESGQLSTLFAEEESLEGEAVEDEIDPHNTSQDPKLDIGKAPKVLVEEEAQATGMVKFRLYKLYLRVVGNPFFWAVMAILIFGSRLLEIGENWWIKEWSHSYETEADSHGMVQPNSISQPGRDTHHPHIILPIRSTSQEETVLVNGTGKSLNYYLIIYCCITMSNIIMGTARYAVLYWGILKANKKLYAQLLHRVLRAPLRFFDTTPIGRILNRFSKDFETIDSSIPNDLIGFVIQWVTIISSIITVGIQLPAFMLPVTLIALINIYFGSVFVPTSRELKRMDSVSRSPLFSNFTETIEGITTIRAFGVTRQFLHNMITYVDTNTRPYYYSWVVNRWISVRFALTGAVINFITGMLILYNVDKMDTALAGFCFSFVLLFTDQMFWGVRRYTTLEMSFNAVERVVEFMEMEEEAPAITENRPSDDWPMEGKIDVMNLEVRYAPDLDPVLKNLSFSVKPREKIGVVGRTGSGKSTLALSFFRFIEATQGSIIIDGIDIKTLGTYDLRSKLTIIPQDPTLFSGSLRSNMDPFDQFDDEEIFVALRRVHLISSDDDSMLNDASTIASDSNMKHVNMNVFKDLNSPVTEGGKNFSQGQRQLLCLARALLKRSRIVLMDEATASVDFETDKAIQKTISNEFVDSTILCIAHRLHTVIEYDRILVLDQGQILEFDSPLTLINDAGSAFYKMCRNSGEFESLMSLARSKHELIDIN
ncbi:P-loop containing nucleoside triphosphate hydrolase protein [Pilobolus umbonatus]|nr:P-loop containing nucleoside triphosphate hydrolase protein [Pilobolus umbonatus]